MNSNETIVFSLFIILILSILFIDLGILNKKNHIVLFKEAMLWTIVWVGISIGFYFFISNFGNLIHGAKNLDDIKHLATVFQHPINLESVTYNEAIVIYNENLGLEYLTGYLIEYALSIDNVFVMILIFSAFGVEKMYYHRVLFWGILGAIVMRFLFIFLSSTLIQHFSWILYIFGVLLVFTGIKMFANRNKEEKINPEKHTIVKFMSKYFPVYPKYVGKKFWVRNHGKLFITPLFIVLIVIEFTDVLFAIDSVPAIFSVTKDPYIVFFSNVFAIIGLRSLFFVLMNVINYFHYLKEGLAILLTVIGIKILAHDWLEQIGFETKHSLFLVVAILGISIIASIIFPKKGEKIKS